MTDEQMTLEEDILQNVANSSELMNSDGEGRYKEARVYQENVKLAIDYQCKQEEIALNRDKLEFEKQKFDEEMTHKRDAAEADLHLKTEIELMKVEIEKQKAKHDRIIDWTNVGIAGVGMFATTGLSWLVLKYNMIMGGETGKDAKELINKIKNWKIKQ